MTTCLLDKECILDSISLLRMQEQSAYFKSPSYDHPLIGHRNAMACWWFSLLEILDYPTEIAEIAMSYSDRFLCTKVGSSIDSKTFRLLCVTCIYTAIKVHGYACVAPSSFAQLCQYEYTTEQIEEMESKLLNALQWRMNPPTGRSFLRLFVELLPVQDDDKQIVLELADYQVVQSMQTEKWISIASSAIAYCAFINALHTMGIDSLVVSSIQLLLRRSLNMDCGEEYDIKNALLHELVLDSSKNDDTLEKVFASSNDDDDDDKLIDIGSKASQGSTSASPRSVLCQESF